MEARPVKTVILSDLHSHNHEQFATTLPGGRNSRLQNILNVLEEARQFCLAKKVDVIFFLGDMFHSRTKVVVDVFSATWLAWKSLAESVKKTFILVGNHDQYNKVGSIHSLEAFREFATVVDQPILSSYMETRFAMHPFTTKIEEWKSFVAMLPSDLDFFFAHQGLSEAVVGAFDISIKAEVGYSDLPHEKAQWILMGHYHKHQFIGEEQRAGYIGSPLQHNMGERTEPKGFLYFEDVKRRPEFVLTHAPSFFLFEDADEFGAMLFVKGVRPERDFIRVKCSETEARQLKEEFPRIQVEVVREDRQEERRIQPEALASDLNLLNTYVDQAEHGLDPERLTSLGLEILSEAV